MRGALEKMPGIGAIDAKVGQMDFAVSFDSKKVTKEAIVKALAATGHPDAKARS